MQIEAIRDRARIEAFLRRNAAAHVYALADLDEPHWPQTRWYGAFSSNAAGARGASGELEALCLLLDGLSIPILYAVCPARHAPTRALLEAIDAELPDRFFYNLGPGLEPALSHWQLAPEGRYWKMVLRGSDEAAPPIDDDVAALGPGDYEELRDFLDNDAYRANETGGLFFEPGMLDTGCYRGIRAGGRLVAVGGVHVHSRPFGVAGIGNVVTRPDARGRGLAGRVSAAVVAALRADTPTIGLNVHEANAQAERCYRRLGFERVCPYEEGVAVRRARAS